MKVYYMDDDYKAIMVLTFHEDHVEIAACDPDQIIEEKEGEDVRQDVTLAVYIFAEAPGASKHHFLLIPEWETRQVPYRQEPSYSFDVHYTRLCNHADRSLIEGFKHAEDKGAFFNDTLERADTRRASFVF